jgi:hypothetical protein
MRMRYGDVDCTGMWVCARHGTEVAVVNAFSANMKICITKYLLVVAVMLSRTVTGTRTIRDPFRTE